MSGLDSFFQDDGPEDSEKFYDSDDEHKEGAGKGKKAYAMDPDHRLLIRNTKPLLQSRNAAVGSRWRSGVGRDSNHECVNSVAECLFNTKHLSRMTETTVWNIS